MSEILGLGRSPGGGNGNPLQDSCLEKPVDRGAWCLTVHGVAKSRTRLETEEHKSNDCEWYVCMCVCGLVLFLRKSILTTWNRLVKYYLPSSFQRRKKSFISKYDTESDHLSDTLQVRYFDFLQKLSRWRCIHLFLFFSLRNNVEIQPCFYCGNQKGLLCGWKITCFKEARYHWNSKLQVWKHMQ